MNVYPHALVADAENLLSVGTDDEVYLTALGLFEEVLFHRVPGGEGEIEALAAPKEMRVVGDRFRLRRALSVSQMDGEQARLLASVGV